MEKLSYPLPSDLRATTLSMNIKQEALEEYLPNLRNIFDTDSLLNEHHGQGKYAHTNRSLKHKEVSSELLDNFDNKLIHISLQIGDENGPYSNEKRKLIWTFKTHISLQSDKTHLLYFLDYINNPKEFFRLGIGSNPSGERIDSDGSLRLFSGLKSAMDLCGQTVYLGIQIGDSQILKPPMLSIRSLSFRDNFSRDYNVEFTGTYTSRSYLRNEKFDKLFPDNKMPDYIDTIYLKGKIKCQSF
ncbi:hypothetical protein [Winogradskyella sp. R77965]|uniref:hypothetical protein n=1 Tax=Winogradskyella sp. R77965 TaxID=3093872 RepID=UPI0037DCEA7A